MKNGVDQKGSILTRLSAFWFQRLHQELPELNTHFITMGLPEAVKVRLRPQIGSNVLDSLEPRTMIVKRIRMLPIESIVRGYITGSAWSSYQKDGTICGISLRTGLRESEKLDKPLWTPSTKAEVGGKDENISPEQGQSSRRVATYSPSERTSTG